MIESDIWLPLALATFQLSNFTFILSYVQHFGTYSLVSRIQAVFWIEYLVAVKKKLQSRIRR